MKSSLTKILGIAVIGIGATGCAATANQDQIDQAMRAAQEARAAAERAQVTADQAKALAEQANAAAEANSKKIDRAFVKSQAK